jgi:hypothetical protein
MKTSKVILRPFIPCLKDEQKDGREPFAVLKYGNVEVELDYTIMLQLEIDNEADCMYKTVGLANRAFKEIVHEMHCDMDKKIPDLHRDGSHPSVLDEWNNDMHPNSPFNKGFARYE